MSDQDVMECIEAIENHLVQDPGSLDAELLMEWNRSFQALLSNAEHGPEWPAIVERAHRLSAAIQEVLPRLMEQRDALKRELSEQVVGQRALKAYGSLRQG